MRAFLALSLIFWSSLLFTAPITPEQVPAPLKPWVGWVLDQHPELKCPTQYNNYSRQCIWPGTLRLDVSQKSATFTLGVMVYRESHLTLPGNRQLWPGEILINGKSSETVEVQQLPSLWLTPGQYEISGKFNWERIPNAIQIPQHIGIVRYTLNNKEVRHPQIKNGRLWLLSGQKKDQEKTPQDRLQLEVYRHIKDGHPVEIITELKLEVSGTQREVVLPSPLLEGFIPLQVSGPIPARIETDGRLRLQVRPGQWSVRVRARHQLPVTMLSMQAQPEPWPQHEIWVYNASHENRVTEIQGVNQIDPRQVRLPGDWSNLPAFQMTPEKPMTIHVVRRGDPVPEPDRLTLHRDIWLDFNGKGYTIRDQIEGKMTKDWRISVDPLFALGQVTIDGDPQFITKMDDKREGVEVRRGRLNLVAESRIRSDTRTLPATGWGRDMQKLNATLHLPPGWQLISASGIDSVPTSWIERWTLFDLFIVLIAALAAGKLWGWGWFPIVLTTMGLLWHEHEAPKMIWLFLLAGVALLRVIPSDNKFHKTVRFLQRAGLVILLIIVIPFAINQARQGLYPQLEKRWVNAHTFERASTAKRQTITSGAGNVLMEQEQPMPSVEAVADALEDSLMGRSKQKVVKSMRAPMSSPARKPLKQFDPNATIQTGPGLPQWKWHDVQLHWSGPVTANQEIQLYLIGPSMHLALNVLMIVLITVFAFRLVGITVGKKPPRKLSELLVLPLLVIPLAFTPQDVVAESFPSPQLLQDLEGRLLQPHIPSPRASISSMHLEVSERDMVVSLNVHTLQDTAIPLPVDPLQITPIEITINNNLVDKHLLRDKANRLWVRVGKGMQNIEIRTRLPNVSQVQIPLPLKPFRVTADIKGWSLDGLNPNGGVYKQLNLTRIQEASTGKQPDLDELAPSVMPAFVRVSRTLVFDLQWEVITRISRQSPPGSPVSMRIPLLTGEQVLTEEIDVTDGQVRVNLGATDRYFTWTSRIDQQPALTLTAGDSDDYIETWQLNVSPIWHVTPDGIPPIHHQDKGANWLPSWNPWPGEQLTLKVIRPEGVAGNSLTIDKSKLTTSPGQRTGESTLVFTMRSSQGGKYDVTIPEKAVLQTVKINGRTQPIRQDKQLVTLPVIPGTQSFELTWRDVEGITGSWQTPRVGLPGNSVNASITTSMPQDRWVLWVTGPDLGPAVLIWGILLVLLFVAYGLHRASINRIPVSYLSWVLLAIGLSQVDVVAGLVVVSWFFALYGRQKMDVDKVKWVFNTTQIGLSILTFATIAILLMVIQQGLLGTPSMQIAGFGSNAYTLNWYQDRVTDALPQGVVVSVPLIVYRLLMLAWALWLAFSLLKWLKWAWQCFSKDGLWRNLELASGRARKTRDQE